MQIRTMKSMIRNGMVLTILAFPGWAIAGTTPSGFGLHVLVNESPRAEYMQDGTRYVEAVRGAGYSLRLTNPTPYRVAVALSVDGLNTIDARHTDPRGAAKWVLEPYESTVISGWQVSDRAARGFFFTGERHSYGAALGQIQNLGVIEAVFFRELHREVTTYEQANPREEMRDGNAPRSQGSIDSRHSAPQAAVGSQKAAAADDYAATGMGRSRRHEVESVNIELESTPAASVRIRYEFRPQLVKLGIFPTESSPLVRRERARGFSAYCPQPE